jgi:hypothetical protein
MPVELSDNPEVFQLEIANRLLAQAILLSPEHTERLFFGESVTFPRSTTAPLREMSPWTWEEFSALNRLFPFSGVEEAREHGLYGTSVRINSQRRLCVALYANYRGMRLYVDLAAAFRPSKSIPIEAVEVGEMVLGQGTLSAGGESVGPRLGSVTGTLGAWLRSGPSGSRVGISNNHVLTECDKFGIGDEVVQPGGGHGQIVGKVAGVVPLKIYDAQNVSGTTNFVDLAWCDPDSSIHAHNAIGPRNLVPIGEADWVHQLNRNPNINLTIPVQVYGKASREAHGVVKGIRACFWFNSPTGVAGQGYYFEDQIEVTLGSVKPGDSGALVMSDPGYEIGGVLFAIDPYLSNTALICPWHQLLNESKLTFRY